MGNAFVIGVGLTKFVKPRGEVSYAELGLEAAVKALIDAGLTYDDIQQAFCSYCYGDSTSGQRVLYQLGMTQIPIYNVNNNCSSGSSAIHLGRQFVSNGIADCVLCIGWEQMERGSLKSKWPDRTNPLDKSSLMLNSSLIANGSDGPEAAKFFGSAGQEYMERYGASQEDLITIAEINHRHSVNNPYSQFRRAYSGAEIRDSALIYGPLTKLQCCPTSDGAAAVIVCSENYLKKNPRLIRQAVEIFGQIMATDSPSLYSQSAIELVIAFLLIC